MINADEQAFTRATNDQLPPTRGRFGVGPMMDDECIFQMRPITQEEVNVYANTWLDCHLNAKQWMLNQRRLNGHISAETTRNTTRG